MQKGEHQNIFHLWKIFFYAIFFSLYNTIDLLKSYSFSILGSTQNKDLVAAVDMYQNQSLWGLIVLFLISFGFRLYCLGIWGIVGIGIESFGIVLYWDIVSIGIYSIGVGKESTDIDCYLFYRMLYFHYNTTSFHSIIRSIWSIMWETRISPLIFGNANSKLFVRFSAFPL